MEQRPSSVRPPAHRPSPSPEIHVSNQLLAALPPDDFTRVVKTLDVIPLELKRILRKPGELGHHVYFPGGGFCSVLTALADGGMVAVATIGREGMVGLAALFDGSPSPSVVMVHAETETCYRMAVGAFRGEMNRRGAFHAVLTRYAHAFIGVVMQTTACNAVHSIEQRFARRLLNAHDRIGTDEFPLAQECVAMMLGAARPTVTVVAGTLEKAGLMAYRRGVVTIVDREKLEAASCECYRTATDVLQGVTSARSAARSR